MGQCSDRLSVIVGPTGVGKTEFALRRAEEWGCPIVNCDSRQIYRELPIGTAAPTAEEQARVRHYFVGTHSLADDYNAGQYERDAVELLRCLMGKGSDGHPFAILTGGSMLYMNAVLRGLDDLPTVPAEVRQGVQQEYEAKGLAWLQEEVKRIDPAYWDEADRSNQQRLLHCVETTRVAGVPYSQLRKRTHAERPWRVHITCLTRPREELYERINRRVDKMMEAGLEEEARRAYLPFKEQGLPIPNSLRTVGYSEMIDYIEGRCTREEAIDKIKQHTRNYAKRQMTWYRNSLYNYSA